MEQVELNSLPTGLVFQNGQRYLPQNNENLNLTSCLNNDIVQEALNGLNATLVSQPQMDINKQGSTIDQSYFLMDKNKDKEPEESVVQLSIREDFPIHLLNTGKCIETLENPDEQNSLLENILGTGSDISDNSLSVDGLSNLLQFTTSNGGNELFEDTSPSVKGNVTYAYKLTNGTKINNIQNGCLAVPVNSTNGFTSVSQQVNPVETVQAPPVKQNGKKFVILRGVNIKQRLSLNLKNNDNQEAAKPSFQKIQIVPANSGFKNIRNIAPQRMVLPPLNQTKTTINKIKTASELSTQNQNVKTPQTQDFRPKAQIPSTQILSNYLKSKAVSNNPPAAFKAISRNSPDPLGEEVATNDKLPVSPQDASALLEVPKSPNSNNKSKERLTESELKKIATAFQNGELKVDKINNSTTIYDSESKTKIICRIVYPEELMKEKTEVVEKKEKKMRGRPRSIKKSPTMLKPPPPEVKKVKKKVNLARTRSGRLSRPPRYKLKDFKKLKMGTSDISCSDSESEIEEENNENTPTVFSEIPRHTQIPRRSILRSKCPTCGKHYPGSKMLIHLSKYPDHGDANTLFRLIDTVEKPPAHQHNFRSEWKKFLNCNKYKLDSTHLKELLNTCSDDIFVPAVKERLSKSLSPWDYLTERQTAGKGAVRGLLSDLADIVNSIPCNMLQKAETCDPNAIHIYDERLCSLLNITPGAYLPNDSVIKPVKEVEPEMPQSWPTPMETDLVPPEKMEKKSDMKVDNTLNLDKKDATELSDLLDRSSLETVDEILNERLNDLIPLDVSSLVESQSLDRSLFSTNSLELHNVSESTEDLLKTLENLTPELPPVPDTTDFDFTVLSSDFVNER